MPFWFGAGGRTRTGTLSPAVDFESTTSTNSITPAGMYGKQMLLYRLHHKNASLFSLFARFYAQMASGGLSCVWYVQLCKTASRLRHQKFSLCAVYKRPIGAYANRAKVTVHFCVCIELLHRLRILRGRFPFLGSE